MLKVENVSKEYPTPGGPLQIVSDVNAFVVAWRCVVDHGTVGQRQEHAALHDGRTGAANQRHLTLDGKIRFN